MSRQLSLLVLVVVLAAGCKRSTREEEAKKVTPTSTDDATKDIVDADYRFRLTWPGTGWKLLREKDARHLNPDALAGLTRGNGVNSIVIVEHLPGAELAAFADVIVDGMEVENKEVAERTATKVSGIDALRIRVTGKINDLPIEFRGLLLIHQEHAYQMLAFVPGSMGSAGDLDTALAAFSIEPGVVKTRQDSTVVEDQVGVGWRIGKGVFESAASRLRARTPPGWRLLVGDELFKMNADADVGMASATVGAYVTVISEPVTGSDVKGYIAGRVDAVMSSLMPLDAPAPTKIIGKNVTLVRGKREAGMPLEYLIGVIVEGQRGYQFIAWYPLAKRSAAEPTVLAALGSFELLSKADLSKLTAELVAAPDRQNFVGATYALRGGTYFDFAQHLRWRLPPGFWKFLVGQEARASNADAMVAASDVVRGLQMELIVEQAGSTTPADYAATVERQLVKGGIVINRRDDAKLGTSKARLLEGKLATAGLALRYRSTSGIVGDLAIQLSLWGAESEWPDEAAISAITSGIELAPSLVDTDEGAHFKDHRLGFTVELPSKWRREDATPSAMKPIASMQQWKSGRNQILVVAIYTLEQHDDAWLIDLVEQTMRQNLASVAASTPETATGKLAGRDARHVIWSSSEGRADLMMFKRDATFYGVLAVSSDGSSSTLETARNAFGLLE